MVFRSTSCDITNQSGSEVAQSNRGCRPAVACSSVRQGLLETRAALLEEAAGAGGGALGVGVVEGGGQVDDELLVALQVVGQLFDVFWLDSLTCER